jgi:hypothetical protein
MTDLINVLNDPASTEAEIASRLKAYRTARDAAKKEVETAQKDLVLYVTLRQEAILIGLGMVD